MRRNTGLLIVDYFKDKKIISRSALRSVQEPRALYLGKRCHRKPFTTLLFSKRWPRWPAAVSGFNPDVKPAPQELQDKHYYRKHGANAC